MSQFISDKRQVQVARTASRAHLASRGGLAAAAAASMLVVGFVAAPSAQANPPEHVRLPIGTNVTFGPGEACPFAVHFEVVGGNRLNTTYDDDRFHGTA